MAEPKIVVNYKEIIESIGQELQDVWYGLKSLDSRVEENQKIIELISNIKTIEISDEQNFVKKRQAKSLLQGTLYIVVRFGAGATNYGSSVSPISLYCVGTANKVQPAQLLLSAFVSTWTTKNLSQGLVNESDESLEISDALQVWNTPEIVTNFNEIDADFKNLFRVVGNIVIGASAVRLGEMRYYYGDGENDYDEVNIMSFHDGYHASLDSQPFGNTGGFAKSEVDFSTYTFSISTYLLSNHLTADMLALRGFKKVENAGTENETSTNVLNPNKIVKVTLHFTNGYENDDENLYNHFKIVDSQIGQEIAGIPSLTITFAR